MIDTNVLVAAFRSRHGASRQLLVAASEGKFQMLASVPLFVEYEAVLTRSEHLRESGLTSREVNDALDTIAKMAVPVHFRFLWRPRLKDPADEMVLETAVNGGADWLVTFNIRHFEAAAAEFGIRAIRPGAAWKELSK